MSASHASYFKITTQKLAGLDIVSYYIMPKQDVPIYFSILSQEHVAGYCGITSQDAVGGQQLV